jgi:hypothetical protein
VDVDRMLRDSRPLEERAAATARRYQRDLAPRAAARVGTRAGERARVPFQGPWASVGPIRYAVAGYVEATRGLDGQIHSSVHYVVCVRAGRSAEFPAWGTSGPRSR